MCLRKNPAIQAKYDRLAIDYDSKWSHYVDTSVEATLRRLDLRVGEVLLDLVCGTGALLSEVRRLPRLYRANVVMRQQFADGLERWDVPVVQTISTWTS